MYFVREKFDTGFGTSHVLLFETWGFRNEHIHNSRGGNDLIWMVTLTEANSLWHNSSLSCLVVLKWQKIVFQTRGKRHLPAGKFVLFVSDTTWTNGRRLKYWACAVDACQFSKFSLLLTVRKARVSLYYVKTAQKMPVRLNDNSLCRKDYKN